MSQYSAKHTREQSVFIASSFGISRLGCGEQGSALLANHCWHDSGQAVVRSLLLSFSSNPFDPDFTSFQLALRISQTSFLHALLWSPLSVIYVRRARIGHFLHCRLLDRLWRTHATAGWMRICRTCGRGTRCAVYLPDGIEREVERYMTEALECIPSSFN
jgi:hypothetical protein